MTTISSPLDAKARDTVGGALQGSLAELIDISLQAKQAHWNIIGPNFRSLHLQLDELVAVTREHADVLAERAIAIGVNPDGRAATVAANTKTPQLHDGYIKDAEVVTAIVALLAAVIDRFRQRIKDTDKPDMVTQDLLISAAQDLEKQHWMFQAQA
ncbi:MAG: DNA starvation/stationary phase protection protein [Corynebacteriales bacterium]|nr:DNA starvation/stationary phase protection protein [Mycobacteriales bacterium]